MVRRRVWWAGGMAAWVLSGRAFGQPVPATVPRIGLLVSEALPQQAGRIDALRAGLADRGYLEGRNLVIEVRSAQGDYDRLPALADELVRLNVGVLVAFGIKALAAARSATKTIPIVVPATSSDPVALGLVDSLARPGGNVTGSTTFGPEIMAKRLELLKEAKPAATRVAVLVNAANASHRPAAGQMDAAAKALRLALSTYAVKSAEEFGPAFAAMTRDRVDGLVVQDDTLFASVNARALVRLASQRRLPVVGNGGVVEAGGAIGYGRSDADLYRRGAYFVDRILKGARPIDLPMEQATRFELLVNTASFREIGLKVPDSLRIRADRVLE